MRLKNFALNISRLSVALLTTAAVAVALGVRLPPLLIALSAGNLELSAGPTTPAVFDDAAGAGTRIPFELVGNKILLRVQVKGSEPLSFVLDTGNKWAMIDLARAQSLGLRLKGEVAVGGGGEKTTPGTFVDDAQFEVLGLKNFRQPLFIAFSMEQLASYAGHRIDGLLGVEFIREFVVEIDWIQKSLILRPKTAFAYSGKGASFPVTFDSSSHPLMRATVQVGADKEKEGLFLLDIGASRALTLNAPFVRQESLLNGLPRVVPLRGFGAGGALKGVASRIDGLRIGEWRLEKPIAAFSQDERGASAATDKLGSIGAEVLRRFRVILDFERDRIILEPNSWFGEPFSHDMSGLMLQATGQAFESLRIAAVDENSPAVAAGFKVGDVLVTIDDRPVSGFDLSEIRRAFEKAARYRLGVRRGETLLSITLVTTTRL